ncbi:MULTISPECIES: 23S rRNA (guanosine(2251)-2'-O)-methyltransferase RlmB [Carboxydothermus]|uniref:RNA methyltransferase, TrmH family, group 3 n=2 Tax=Carboxydothermus TaxID=129957 RepID=Q3A9P4_CARHZ|nr:MULTISPECIES: 23S rRNA (guanosine(2251)-2'-O)-methyltransferase RlmB [Carboxydothermus]ABB15142.1 RNA methyltransferase, TrmH family, group 3 [Carboxydothermus hydrogenoformans Z-2901]NYE57923.1 23S rRNA (guanosine2251-2'-O)-methyltransferase [Carboxydothermus ferrireducens DSM 11255]
MERIYGVNPVREALMKGIVNKLYLSRETKDKNIRELLLLARENKVPVVEVPREKLHAKSQGVEADISPVKYVEIDDILAIAERKAEPLFILVLNHLEDPQNLGAILRSAEAFGVHGVIIPKRRAVQVTGAVAKASAGAYLKVPVARCTNVAETLRYLKEKGAWVVGADAKSKASLWDTDFKLPLALVIGGENVGLTSHILRECDFTVSIPMVGTINSLNASVAAALLMAEVVRQRRG